MDMQIKLLAFDPNALDGLSERLVSSHHQNNYQGAVRRLNSIRRQLAEVDWPTAPVFTINGLKREELIAFNSAVLHELYFACLGGDGKLPAGPLGVAIERDFGSFERWRAEFVALAKAMGGGSGWAILSWSAREARMVNHWAADHSDLLAGSSAILALDMYEHAYHLDFGPQAGAYVDAFMRNVQWTAVEAGYADAVQASSASLAIEASAVVDLPGVQLVDVRRAGVFANAEDLAATAIWRDPAQVYDWAGAIDASRPVAVYCVHGHEISRSTALALKAVGSDARFVVGGYQAWKASGLPVVPKEDVPEMGQARDS